MVQNGELDHVQIATPPKHVLPSEALLGEAESSVQAQRRQIVLHNTEVDAMEGKRVETIVQYKKGSFAGEPAPQPIFGLFRPMRPTGLASSPAPSPITKVRRVGSSMIRRYHRECSKSDTGPSVPVPARTSG